ncbi:hypothetical protein MKEN_01284000 [Mycena kentingensis (nom. inval.)]|nr:hypothetical protein MKEN_01284000 [Mycena kentingensis (nom. inval.)]
MDPNFSFPRSRPTLRPQPAQPSAEPVNRESNALRASVLDAALELGLGNKTVANWMFNNALDEEEEEPDEEPQSRAPLSPTSEESAPYSTPPTSTESYSEAKPVVSSPASVPSPQVQFPGLPAGPGPAPNKLRKQRRENGYESDGGYVSDNGKKARARTKSKPKAPDSAVVYPISEPMELIPLSKEERKRKKKENKTGKDNGAETDTEDVPKVAKSKSTKKTKKGSADAGAGYETDDGYISAGGKKKGRRFFGLRKKSDSASEPMPEPVPPMPEREVFDLPIASRFATTLPPSAAPSVAPSRAETPLPPPSRPFASASGSSSPSSTSSLLTPADQDSFMLRVHATNTSLETDGASPDHITMEQALSSKSKFFISFPMGRKDGSDSPPQAPKSTPSPLLLSPIASNVEGHNPRSASPGSSPMGSPFVLLTPMNTSGNARAPSPAPSSTEVVPYMDFIVPSRSTSPLPPSPNVLSYYDVPPPSPPPTSPLPRPPPSAMREGPDPGVARLRSMSRDHNIPGRLSPIPPENRSVSPGPWASSATRPISPGGNTSPLSPMSAGGARRPISPIQRGRAAPFPAQPILQARPAGNPGVGPGLADRVKVARYRDLYALNIPDVSNQRAQRRYWDEDEASVNINVDEGSDEEVEEDAEIAGVLGRFRDPTPRDRAPGNGVALERNNSGVLRPGARQRVVRFSPEPSPTRQRDYEEDDDDASRYPDDERTAGRKTMYRFDSNGEGSRDTMYSEYSRTSFMDVSRSEQARGRLVDRVGMMYDHNGREVRSPAPPVPRLPPELLAGANRF